MTVAAQTQKSPKNASFEIKSSQLSILVFHLKSPDLQLVAREMERQFADSPDFFDGEPVIIDTHALFDVDDSSSNGNADVEGGFPLQSLIELLSLYRLKAVGVRGAPSSIEESIRASGLFVDHDIGDSTSLVAQANEKPQEPAPSRAGIGELVVETSAMVIDRPLRSGQQVYARGRDLVVLSMVNPGAEVIADGHIHVYAPLRGKAMAGAAGDIRARIFAASLEAELLSIAGIWQTSEALQKDRAWGGSAQVRLVLDDGASASIEPPADTSSSRARLVISRLGD